MFKKSDTFHKNLQSPFLLSLCITELTACPIIKRLKDCSWHVLGAICHHLLFPCTLFCHLIVADSISHTFVSFIALWTVGLIKGGDFLAYFSDSKLLKVSHPLIQYTFHYILFPNCEVFKSLKKLKVNLFRIGWSSNSFSITSFSVMVVNWNFVRTSNVVFLASFLPHKLIETL